MSSVTPATGQPAAAPEEQVPILEPGDRLSQPEFERRYDAMPQLKKAELIEGVVHVPSPTRFRRHGRPHAHLIGWLVAYEAGTPGVETGDNTTARLDLANEPQPDALLIIDPARGGQARISADDYIEDAPELVAEVSASSVSIDLGTKLTVYLRNGVREYLVWRVLDQQLDWFVLRQGQYEQLTPDAQGWLRSEVFPGLWLDPAALLRRDLATVLAVLRQGLASAEHAAFVSLLQSGHTSVCRNAAAHVPSDLAIAIVTVEEILGGWYAQLRRGNNDAKLLRAYAALQQAVAFTRQVRVVPFDAFVLHRYHQLRSLNLRLGTNDLRIAATALEHQAVLVNRNRSDFGRSPGLSLEDWS